MEKYFIKGTNMFCINQKQYMGTSKKIVGFQGHPAILHQMTQNVPFFGEKLPKTEVFESSHIPFFLTFARAAVILFFFASALLIFGCPLEGNTGNSDVITGIDSNLDGVWKAANIQSNPDYFIIDVSAETLSYNGGGSYRAYDYDGTIVYAEKCNADSGFLVIQFNHRPVDYATHQPVTGNFIAIVYRELAKDKSVKIAIAADLGGGPLPATETLDQAKKKFSKDTIGSYIGNGVPQYRKEGNP
jgi:hypothetical protein